MFIQRCVSRSQAHYVCYALCDAIGRIFDLDGSGTIDEDELKTVLRLMGEQMTDDADRRRGEREAKRIKLAEGMAVCSGISSCTSSSKMPTGSR